MNIGQIISGLGHLALIVWVLVGDIFNADPLPFEVTEVTAISSEDYAALIAAQQNPEAVANVDTPGPPEEADAAPVLSPEPDEAPEVSQPEVAEVTPPDDPPEVPEVAPLPDTEVSDEPPEIVLPTEDVAVLVPEVAEDPTPQEAPRVAPEPVAQPEPDVQIDDVTQPEVQPDEAAEVQQEETDATSEEAATTEIVTEAETPSVAPTASLRPRTRPARPEPTETAQEEPAVDNTAVHDALTEALGEANDSADTKPSGPPLTRGEKDALRIGVEKCWNVGALSSDALQTIVVVGFSMSENAKPIDGSIRQVGATGGSGTAVKQAYEAARRAIIRCGANGYDLPKDKYSRWRNIEITFNPEKMRIK